MLTIFRLITSLRFYAGIICMSFLVLWLSQTTALSFRWVPAIGISTSINKGNQTFVPRKAIQEKAIALTYTNIFIGNEGSSQLTQTQIGSPDGNDVSKALFFTKSLEETLSVDIVGLVKNSSERTVAMQTFLNQGENLLRQASITAQNLQNTIVKEQSSLATCQIDKTEADTQYTYGLSTNNSSQVESATAKATIANECIGRQNTIINSTDGVLDRLTTAITNSTNYTILIRNNQLTIIQYPDLVNSSTPQELLDLQRSLTNVRSL